jgi:hypothetical protein|tara:strand:+ start:235 stop:594 length:360 start_codon:yes stop_codon:yes gene_type:complete
LGITTIVDMFNQYGVPTVVAVGMAYFIYYVWKFVTHNILPSLGAASNTLVGLIDRVRMLDNDMIRLDQKIHTIIEIQNQQLDPFESANKKRMEARQAELDSNQDKKIRENKKEISKLKK